MIKEIGKELGADYVGYYVLLQTYKGESRAGMAKKTKFANSKCKKIEDGLVEGGYIKIEGLGKDRVIMFATDSFSDADDLLEHFVQSINKNPTTEWLSRQKTIAIKLLQVYTLEEIKWMIDYLKSNPNYKELFSLNFLHFMGDELKEKHKKYLASKAKVKQEDQSWDSQPATEAAKEPIKEEPILLDFGVIL